MSEDNSDIDEIEDQEELLEEDEEFAQMSEQIAEESGGSSHLSASDDGTPWIIWFVSLRGHDFFCEIDEDYLQDDFNLTGLHSLVPYYNYALDFILDVDIAQDTLIEEQREIVETAAKVLYGLIHARYILTARGMQRMLDKYEDAGFGRCPRVLCQDQFCLPLGLSDLKRSYPLNIYCPRCQELYIPRSTKHAALDGAYFGTTFAHMFLLTYPDLIPKIPSSSSNACSPDTYVPKIYGFRIHKDSCYYKLRELESGKDEEDFCTESDRDSAELGESIEFEEGMNEEAYPKVEGLDLEAKESRRRAEPTPTRHQNFIKIEE